MIDLRAVSEMISEIGPEPIGVLRKRSALRQRKTIVGHMKVTSGGPLGAVVYLDEVTPGNVLRPDNRRKFWAVYLGVKEFPPTALYREQFWLPLAILRTSVAHEVRGGISYCFRALLNSVLLAPCQLADIGVAVDLGSGPRLVRLEVKHILADEAALKAVWSSKGAAGVRPCMLCRNVVALRSNIVEGQDYLVDVSCSNTAKFHESTDADIWEAWDHLAAESGRLTKGTFANLEKASGFSYHPDALLADHGLRRLLGPASCTTMDWLHNCLQNGIASQEICAFLSECKAKLGITYKDLEQFVAARWSFPRGQMNHKVDSVFSQVRERSGGTEAFKAGASETLMVFPLLRHFVETVVKPTGCLDDQCDSMLLMCGIIDAFLGLKRGTAPPMLRLESLLSTYLEKHKAVYGLAYIKPKHHFAFHNAMRHKRSGEVFLDCFALERKHQGVKAFGTTVKNTSSFESSVLARAIVEQRRQIQGTSLGDSLVGPAVQDERLSNALGPNSRLAKALNFQGLLLGVNDVVLFDAQAALVKACAQMQDGALVLLVCLLSRTGGGSAYTVWRPAGPEVHGLRLDGSVVVSVPYAWTLQDDGCVLSLQCAAR